MPTPDLTTFALVHDLSRGAELGAADPVDGFLTRLPSPLFAGDSYNITLVVYEKYSTTSPVYCDWPADGASFSVKCWIKHADTVEDPVLVSTGTATTYGTTGKRCQMNFTIYKDDLPDTYAGTAPVLLIFQVVDTSTGTEVQVSVTQRLNLVNENGSTLASLYTKDIDVSVSTLVAATSLTAYVGKAVYLLDGTSAVVPVTLPTLTAGVPQEIVLHCINAANAVTTVAATINGVAATSISFAAGDTVHLISNGTSWYCLNYSIFVRP